MSEATESIRVEEIGKRVRTYLGGEVVADTLRPRLVWERYYPVYYLPVEDVRTELLRASPTSGSEPRLGEARYFTVEAGGKVARDAAWQYPSAPAEDLRGLVRFEWTAMDAWFEEEEEVIVHPRDPYHRLDILDSARHVEVVVNGVRVADSRSPRLMFETGVSHTRHYLPPADVRTDLLRPSSTTSACPYKGIASYWSVEAGGVTVEDLVWSYRDPLPESSRVAGLLCFWAERSDRVELRVDGVRQ